MALPIPILAQAAPMTMTNAEWVIHHNGINAWMAQSTLDIHALNPTAQIEAQLVIFTTNPTTNTGKLGCMAQVQAWMYCIQQQEQDLLHTANLAQQVAAVAADTLPAPPPLPPPPLQCLPPAGAPPPQFQYYPPLPP